MKRIVDQLLASCPLINPSGVANSLLLPRADKAVKEYEAKVKAHRTATGGSEPRAMKKHLLLLKCEVSQAYVCLGGSGGGLGAGSEPLATMKKHLLLLKSEVSKAYARVGGTAGGSIRILGHEVSLLLEYEARLMPRGPGLGP